MVSLKQKDLKRLWGATTHCAFGDPKCDVEIIDPDNGSIGAEIAHIAGKNPGSARYDENMAGDDRDSIDNLVLLCPNHHTVVDSEAGRQMYSAPLLSAWKKRAMKARSVTPENENAIKTAMELAGHTVVPTASDAGIAVAVSGDGAGVVGSNFQPVNLAGANIENLIVGSPSRSFMKSMQPKESAHSRESVQPKREVAPEVSHSARAVPSEPPVRTNQTESSSFPAHQRPVQPIPSQEQVSQQSRISGSVAKLKTRLLARLIDSVMWLFLLTFGLLLMTPFFPAPVQGEPVEVGWQFGIGYLLGLAAIVGYEVLLGRATVGKMFLRLLVASGDDGSQPRAKQKLIRAVPLVFVLGSMGPAFFSSSELAVLVSVMLLLLSLLFVVIALAVMLNDNRKQAPWGRLSQTIVISK